MATMLRFEGSNYLRQRLVLATLSQRTITITQIRADEEAPGLKGNLRNYL